MCEMSANKGNKKIGNPKIVEKDRSRDLSGIHERLLKRRQLERRRYLQKTHIVRPQQGNSVTPSFNFTPTIPLEELKNQGILKRRSSLTSAKFRETKERILREEIDVIGAIKALAEKVHDSRKKTFGIWKSLPILLQNGPTSKPVLASATYRRLRDLDSENDEKRGASSDEDEDCSSSSSSSSLLDTRGGATRSWVGWNKENIVYGDEMDMSLRFRTILPPLVTQPNEQTFRDVIYREEVDVLRKLVRWRRDSKTLTIGELNHALLIAISRQEVEMAELLLMAGAEVEAFSHYNPLILQAAFTNNTEMVRTLLRFGANPNSHYDPQFTPLYFACHRSNFDMTKVLVSEGQADVTLASRRQLTPLMTAARVGNTKCVNYLLYQCSDNVNAMDDLGKTALHYAAAAGKIRIIRSLLKHGSEVFVADSTYMTPYITAMMYHHKDIADLLRLRNVDERIEDTIDGYKNTMLVHAVRCGHHESARDLIGRGASVADASIGNPYPIISWALETHDVQMVKLLAPLTDLCSPINNIGYNAIQFFTLEVFEPKSNELNVGKGIEIMETLVNHGSNINAAMPIDYSGRNMLLHCAQSDHAMKVQYLLNIGANPNILDEEGCTAMWHACLKNNHSLVSDLIMGNFDMTLTNIVGGDNETPMQHYIRNYETNTDELIHLVSAGASLSGIARNIDGIITTSLHSDSVTSQNQAVTIQEDETTEPMSPEKKLLFILRQRSVNAKPLEEICKLEIKRHLSTGLQRLNNDIDQLPLPDALKQYIRPFYKEKYLETVK